VAFQALISLRNSTEPVDFIFQLTEGKKLDLVANCDHQFKIVFDAIRQLMIPPPVKGQTIGFRPKALRSE
jgi:hypothetical protein